MGCRVQSVRLDGSRLETMQDIELGGRDFVFASSSLCFLFVILAMMTEKRRNFNRHPRPGARPFPASTACTGRSSHAIIVVHGNVSESLGVVSGS